MEIRHLDAFEAVARHRHFTRAAEELHITQPALSVHIKQLERELGVTLMSRTTRRVSLTEAGQHLWDHVGVIRRELGSLREHMSLFADGRTGRVRVGCVGTATYDILPLLARRMRAELPDVDLEVKGELLTSELLTGLVAREFDLVLVRQTMDVHGRTEPSPDRASRDTDERLDTFLDAPLDPRLDIVVEHLRTERLIAAVATSHPLASRRHVSLAELALDPFVSHPADGLSAYQPIMLAACARAGFVPQIALTAPGTAALMLFVAAGIGVSLVPAPVTSLKLDGVAYLDLDEDETVDLVLASRRGERSAAVLRTRGLVVDLVSTA
ncbi:LysR family transcriptional regulator [Nocardioides cavernae]|uniref:LysR family transcriptional regulator n=1 Tax=Nocardioides cavernae TaxID=1921566 RepID=A0ABR8N7U2_9ACTN|nr:LysR family transcriptional regulator [Nocardioides cavernae]MBD3924212.1 LysR family transcriptional regulator [Nocardioides cavernae]MBM7510850.1 DNA-binding transcriptional LysR family regulator [Nocardioides cavernae]